MNKGFLHNCSNFSKIEESYDQEEWRPPYLHYTVLPKVINRALLKVEFPAGDTIFHGINHYCNNTLDYTKAICGYRYKFIEEIHQKEI